MVLDASSNLVTNLLELKPILKWLIEQRLQLDIQQPELYLSQRCYRHEENVDSDDSAHSVYRTNEIAAEQQAIIWHPRWSVEFVRQHIFVAEEGDDHEEKHGRAAETQEDLASVFETLLGGKVEILCLR